MDRFEAVFAACVATIRRVGGPQGCIVDASLSPPQSARTVARHAEVRHRHARGWTSPFGTRDAERDREAAG